MMMPATNLGMGLRCIKYLLFAVNALFALTGMMIISMGTTIYAIYENFSHFLDPTYFSPATLLMVIGGFIFVIAFMGCWGALKESTCMVLVFAVSLSLVLVLEISAAIAAYSLQGTVKSFLAEKINTTMYEYETNTEAKIAIDFMQSRMRCCGIYSYEDWEGILTTSQNQLNFTASCCDTDYEGMCFPFEAGCIGHLGVIIHQSALYIGTGAIAIAMIQLSGIMFACTLGRAIRRQKIERERRRWELRESLVNGYQPLGKTDPVTTFPVVYMQSPDLPLKHPSN